MNKEPSRHRRHPSKGSKPLAGSSATATSPDRNHLLARMPPWFGALATWWVASVIILLAANVTRLGEPVALIPPPDNSLLAGGEAWNPWLSRFPSLMPLFVWPTWLAIAAIAVLIAAVAQRTRRCTAAVCAIAMVVGLCQIDPHGGFLAACLTYAAVRLRDRVLAEDEPSRDKSLRTFAIVGLISGAALATTLEMAIPLAIVALTIVSICRQTLADRQQVGLVFGLTAGWLLLLIGLVALQPGLLATMIRPVTAIANRPLDSLMPSMQVIWQTPDFGWPHVVVLLFIIDGWRRWFMASAPRLSDGLLLALFTALAIGSGRYFWLASIAFACTASSDRFVLPQTASVKQIRRWNGAAIGMALAFLVVHVGLQRDEILGGLNSARNVDTEQWNLAGPVVLQNLDLANHWKLQDTRRALPLVVSDRWDTYGDFYPQYAAIVNDWSNWREHRYVRSDGQWGGFRKWFDEWNPKLIVVNANDLSTIRHHSLDSPWKTLGIDSRRVIFAQSDDRDSSVPLRESARLLSILEIPRPAPDVYFERTIAFGGPAESRKVSLVLSALRFPFAALRVLPDDDQTETEYARTMALLESAHRTLRYAGVPSLIDQTRALAHSQKLFARSDLQPPQRQQIETAISALQSLRARVSVSVEGLESRDGSNRVEHLARELLLNGEFYEAMQIVGKMSESPLRDMFIVAGTMGNATPQVIYQALDFSSGHLATDRHHDRISLLEAQFHRGFLMVETGDFPNARLSFQKAIESNLTHPLGKLGALYHAASGVRSP
ncbi:hypothetical protein Poly24_31250 [Rosistilla carotiformis]|uniref:Uncharacterized protein n=1 Tax=Rosistilla carotiformis TaxID=2528017 RepID=A0A518JV51_9BACT|nr:hypothetical protein [Rosistilla carotiformis]QDV69409.1 hypothetical protein Poly24_31250 [Rosistilla carotiformis]